MLVIHQIHKYGGRVCETKWHDHEFELSVSCVEHRLLDVSFMNSNLIIPGLQVYLGEFRTTPELVKQVINSGQRVFVLFGYFVELVVVDA